MDVDARAVVLRWTRWPAADRPFQVSRRTRRLSGSQVVGSSQRRNANGRRAGGGEAARWRCLGRIMDNPPSLLAEGADVAEAPVTFSGLLRRLRAGSGLTQEELASAAKLSRRAVSDLERAVAITPQRDTVRLLADALHLIGPERAQFEMVARGRPLQGASEVPLPRCGHCRGTWPRSPDGSGNLRGWPRPRRVRAVG